MAGRVRTRTTVAAAVAVIGIGALTGCAIGSPAPRHTALTTKAAGAYYVTTTCDLRAADSAFSVALLNAQQSIDSTGPDLDSLTAAARGYQKASRAAAARLADRKVVWPRSVRKPIAALVDDLRALASPLGKMAAATNMADARTAYSDLPDNSGTTAVAKEIRSRLGVTSEDPVSCPAAEPEAITAPPATGIVITGTGYSFHAPAGWTLPQRATKADAYAISARPDANGFYDTVNVLLGPPDSASLDEQQRKAAEYLEQQTEATQVRIRPRVEIAGEESMHISSLAYHQGITQWQEQYSVTHGGAAFLITLSFDQGEPQSDRQAVADSVLASWRWV